MLTSTAISLLALLPTLASTFPLASLPTTTQAETERLSKRAGGRPKIPPPQNCQVTLLSPSPLLNGTGSFSSDPITTTTTSTTTTTGTGAGTGTETDEAAPPVASAKTYIPPTDTLDDSVSAFSFETPDLYDSAPLENAEQQASLCAAACYAYGRSASGQSSTGDPTTGTTCKSFIYARDIPDQTWSAAYGNTIRPKDLRKGCWMYGYELDLSLLEIASQEDGDFSFETIGNIVC